MHCNFIANKLNCIYAVYNICHIYFTFCYNSPISDDDNNKNAPIPNDDDDDDDDDDGYLGYIQNLHYIEIWI